MCTSGRPAQTWYKYTPFCPYNGYDEPKTYNTAPKPSSVSPNTSPSSTSTPKTSPFKYLNGGVFAHFMMNRDTLSNVDPIKEVSSSLGQRSESNNMSQSLNSKLNKSNSEKRNNVKLRSGENHKTNIGANVQLSSDTNMKPRSGNIKNSRSGDTKTKPNVKFKDTNINLKSNAGHHRNRLYLDSGLSINIIFNKGLLGKLKQFFTPVKIAAAGQQLEIKQISILHKALQHLPLPRNDLYYEPTAIENLLPFAKVADEYYVI